MLLKSRVENPAVSRFLSPWRVLRFALLLAFLSFASRALNFDSWNAGGVTILWPTNGLLMGILLCNPKRHWPVYLTVAGIVDLMMNVSLGDSLPVAGYLTCCNLFERRLARFSSTR
jgi:integral membrane sensor domain MASE1